MQRKGFFSLALNVIDRKQKQRDYLQAFKDRERDMKNETLYKILKVGHYWRSKKTSKLLQGRADPSTEPWPNFLRLITMKQALYKWYKISK